jgi:uncharacterized protein DUF5658
MDTKTIHDVLFYVADFLAMAGQYLDCQTTDTGLSHGMIEANSLAVKIYSKIGAAGFFALKCIGVPGLAAVAFTSSQSYGWAFGLAVSIPFAVIGFVAGITNYKLLKKNNIPISLI